MPIHVIRDTTRPTRHIVHVRNHVFPTDITVSDGGEDTGPDPHDFYDSALAACKALTVVWYARKKGIAVDDVRVSVTRDASGERQGQYKLATELSVSGDLSDAQRRELLSVAEKCPIHKLMTQVTTEVTTVLAESAVTTAPEASQ